MLKNLKNYVPVNLTRTACFAFFLSIIPNGILLWGKRRKETAGKKITVKLLLNQLHFTAMTFIKGKTKLYIDIYIFSKLLIISLSLSFDLISFISKNI